jgi:hypothetical protein
MSKRYLVLGLLCLSQFLNAAETTNVAPKVHLNALGLKVTPGKIINDGVESTVILNFGGPNEVYFSSFGMLFFHDGATGEEQVFGCSIESPGVDANLNGIPDVFEFEPAVEDLSLGALWTEFADDSPINIKWSKPEKSRYGTFSLNSRFSSEPTLHTFELVEYEGEWNPRRYGNHFEGPLSFRMVGDTNRTLTGVLGLQTNKDGEPRMAGMPLTNDVGIAVIFVHTWLSDYAVGGGSVHMGLYSGGALSGDNPFAGASSRLWKMNISGGNLDEDQNGKGDLFEYDPIPYQPRLEISQDESTVTVKVLYDPAFFLAIDSSPILPAGQWSWVDYALAFPPEIRIPKPDAPMYWRARALPR